MWNSDIRFSYATVVRSGRFGEIWRRHHSLKGNGKELFLAFKRFNTVEALGASYCFETRAVGGSRQEEETLTAVRSPFAFISDAFALPITNAKGRIGFSKTC